MDSATHKGSKTVKTTMKECRAAMIDLEKCRAAHNRVAAHRVGVISGGPSIDQENHDLDLAIARVENLFLSALRERPTRRRYRFLLDIAAGDVVPVDILDLALSEIDEDWAVYAA